MATAQELFGAEAGAAPGLECWRIEAMKPLPNADALKGRFCEGEHPRVSLAASSRVGGSRAD